MYTESNVGIAWMRDMARIFHTLGLFGLGLTMIRRSGEQTNGGTGWWPAVAFEPEEESRDDDTSSFAERLDVPVVRIPRQFRKEIPEKHIDGVMKSRGDDEQIADDGEHPNDQRCEVERQWIARGIQFRIEPTGSVLVGAFSSSQSMPQPTYWVMLFASRIRRPSQCTQSDYDETTPMHGFACFLAYLRVTVWPEKSTSPHVAWIMAMM